MIYLTPQSHGNHDKETGKTATPQYHSHTILSTKTVLKSQFNGNNKIHVMP